MIRNLEYQFLREYESDGAAYLSLQYALFKYCGIGSEVPARPDFPDGVILEIKERTEACQVWPYNGIENICPLFDEISDNLDGAASDVVRVNYVISILKKLQRWAWLYSLGAEKLSAISNSVEHNSLEYFYWDWLRAFNSFADKLAVALAMRGINLLEIQSRCDIRIIDNLDANRLWMDFGTPAMAEYYLSALKPFGSTPQPKPKKVGRKVESFRDNLLVDEDRKDALLAKLHSLMNGRKGKDLALIVYSCVKMGWMTKPTFTQIESEFSKFGDVGNKSGFNNYANNPSKFTDDEINGMMERLKSL